MTKIHAGILGASALAALVGGGFIDLLALGATGAVAYAVGAKDKVK